ncbi:hypothetical protein Hanom_Chr02g00149601 [Helianthus anomalus]
MSLTFSFFITPENLHTDTKHICPLVEIRFPLIQNTPTPPLSFLFRPITTTTTTTRYMQLQYHSATNLDLR